MYGFAKLGAQKALPGAESTMLVKDLIEVLKDLEPNAQVLIASQPNWPFEVELAGIVTRAECDDEPEQQSSLTGAATDVFLVEGQQLRYGSRTPFRMARRRR